jgi:hypothetical protein
MIRLYLSPGIRIGRGKEIQVKIMKPMDMPMGVRALSHLKRTD